MSHFTADTVSLSLLNDLRKAHSMSPLKAWKESRAKLVDVCNKLYTTDIASSPIVTQEEIALHVDVKPINDEQEAATQRILDNKSKKAKAAKEKIITQAKESRLETNARRDAKKVEELLATKNAYKTVAEYCKEAGINPKIARAKLRKAGVKQINGHWVATKDAIAALTK